jgi:hypothetical protein
VATSETETTKPLRRRARALQGNDLLYHYFQKTLLEENPEQFKAVVRGLILGLGIWLPPAAYQRMPLLVPYAVRDATCRGNKRHEIPDQWGAPDAHGRFRDDNSLIKGIPRSLAVRNPSNGIVHGSRMGTGFVAAHAWRKLNDGSDAPKNELTYSFLPNLVWLPAQLAKLTDREEGFAQTLLQVVSVALYRRVPLAPKLAEFVAPIWAMLPVRKEGRGIDVPTQGLNFFMYDDLWLARRRRAMQDVLQAVAATHDGVPVTSKVVATRYGDGLATLSRGSVGSLLALLGDYTEAVDEALASA